MLTKSGRAIECDTVIVGAGVRPDAMLAQRAGLEVDDGIVCDSKLMTSAEGIYAAGDCCSYDSVVHGRRIRVEHWDVAMQQGMHAAGNMLGEDRDYDVVPYFFSDLADWASLEYVGPAKDWDEEIWRGDREGGEFSVWYLKDGKVAGALSVGRSEDLAEARRMLADGVDVSAARERIADADSDLAGSISSLRGAYGAGTGSPISPGVEASSNCHCSTRKGCVEFQGYLAVGERRRLGRQRFRAASRTYVRMAGFNWERNSRLTTKRVTRSMSAKRFGFSDGEWDRRFVEVMSSREIRREGRQARRA